MLNLKIALHQFNPVVGDLSGNIANIVAAIHAAQEDHCDLFITSELAICGYFPEDLLLRDGFAAAVEVALQPLLQIAGITIICGVPERVRDDLRQSIKSFNSALVIRDGKILHRYDKRILCNYGVFDEKRYFDAGNNPLVFACGNVQVGVVICEDMWGEGDSTLLHYPNECGSKLSLPVAATQAAGADLICIINASPYEIGKHAKRIDAAKCRVQETGLPLIYVNQVGGQDELVFDGASFVLDKTGEVCLQLPAFVPELAYFEYINPSRDTSVRQDDKVNLVYPSRLESVYSALVLALKDYVHKNGFKGVTLGLSGGIDSALTLAIAYDALGKDNVFPVLMPSKYTADISIIDANDMIARLGVKSTVIEIDPIFNQFTSSLVPSFADLQPVVADTTYENLQARTRGTLLMAISNRLGYLVITTGNKSEMTTGYATLYGDMAGGFALLKDVSKTLVYELSNFRNTKSAIIPPRIITRPPTAELRENQTDQDSLPEYAILDQVLTYLVEDGMSVNEIIAKGFAADVVHKIARLLQLNEYKRRQAAVGPKITRCAFGHDWRYPITNKFVL